MRGAAASAVAALVGLIFAALFRVNVLRYYVSLRVAIPLRPLVRQKEAVGGGK